MNRTLFATMLTALLLLAAGGSPLHAQRRPIPPLHVEGKNVVDPQGNPVVLHGVGLQPNNYWYHCDDWGKTYDLTEVPIALNYFHKHLEAITDTLQGGSANCIRLHIDPAWTVKRGSPWQEENEPKSADWTRIPLYIRMFFAPLAIDAVKHGLYVVIRPPGSFTNSDEGTVVGDEYNQYILRFFDVLTQNDSIRKYSGRIMLELGNEPVKLWDRAGRYVSSDHALHDYFQPVVDKIRQNGFRGVIWLPGTNYQMIYGDYAKCPVEDDNIGYATHCYPGWYGHDDTKTVSDLQSYVSSIRGWWPVIDTNPILVTEVDWSPATNPDAGHYNELGEWVDGNYGTWGTARTSHWGNLYMAMCDYFGNVGTLSLGAYLDINYYERTGIVRPVYPDVEEACGWAFYRWFQDLSHGKNHAPAMQRLYTADTGYGKFQNPILRTHLPGAGVFRQGDWFFLASECEGRRPAAVLLRSRDLVNWQYCASADEQLALLDPDGTLRQQTEVTTQTGEQWRIRNEEDALFGATVCLEPVNGKIKKLMVKPSVGRTDHWPASLDGNDTFTDPILAPCWQETADATGAYSLTARPGCLRLSDGAALQQLLCGMADNTTKLYSTISLDGTGMAIGDRLSLSIGSATLSVANQNGQLRLEAGETTATATSTGKIFLRIVVNPAGQTAQCDYSTDNQEWQQVAERSAPLTSYRAAVRLLFSGTGHADLDWFSTEPVFSEELFYRAGQLQPKAIEAVTASSLTATDIEVTPGSRIQLPVRATFQDGHTENVAARCLFTASPLATCIDGYAEAGAEEGATTVTAIHTDATGQTLTAQFNVRVSLFPLTEPGLNTSVYGKGKLNTTFSSLLTAEGGYAGWHYPKGVDLSRHRYLVIKMRRAPKTGAAFSLFDSTDIFGTGARVNLEGQSTATIDLQELRKTDGTALDLTAIRYALFTTDGKQAIYPTEVFLSDDGQSPSGIQSVAVMQQQTEQTYDLQGRRLTQPGHGISIVRKASGKTVKMIRL